MNMILGIITLVMAVSISLVAAYISVSGMMALFAGTATVVAIMMIVLEAGKLVAAQWLHTNWRDRSISWLHKLYLVAAVLGLMGITSIGIYGFLSKGHLEHSEPVFGTELQIEQKEAKIKQLDGEIQRANEKFKQLDQSIAIYLNGSDAKRGLSARSKQKSERDQLDKLIAANQNQISKLQEELVPLKTKTSEVEAKLGPVKYVAALFGWEDPNIAVRMIILTLMFAFDPLAVVLLISASITFEQIVKGKTKASEAAVTPTPEPVDDPLEDDIPHDDVSTVIQEEDTEVPTTEPEVPVTETDYELLNRIASSYVNDEKKVLIEILERKPELLNNLIEAIRDEPTQEEPKQRSSWLKPIKKP